MANNGLDYIVGAISKFAAIFSINSKSGEVSEIDRIEADFHEKEPEVTKTRWSQDNKIIISGGEEGILRVFKVNFAAPNQVSGFELTNELGQHSEGITDISINSDNSLVVSASTDKTCRIYTLKDEKCIKRLSFSEGIGMENLKFKGSLFSPDSRFLYALATSFKGRSYLIKWDAKSENFDPIDTTPVHTGPSCAFDLSSDGSNAAIGTNNGHVVAVNANSMSVYRSEKKHKMPITNI
mmetsp:Transcript_3755/g.3484  ORF Transcript_3755/g.3484 Transcript_3755/m.3484 type:complete len:238 (+) Transcript_3755:200-913(+)|eukprot:CAMPEP_0197008050 /NCGR_PEP_ID=MMETSP1380-20130617/43531_1 /TAXON_ID=5936 /ORGANISM="Euplotes crassus, Strain CT5" /LENGTH=237 /DNA_ID=CAMNT_0042428443 /DNA_START=199 /DNA_END=912 /DNA_ORIENTATION=+